MAIRRMSGTALASLLFLGATLAIAQDKPPSGSAPPASATTPDQPPVGETGAIQGSAAPEIEKLAEAARETIRKFKERLKGELSTAIKSDGVANAVSLCQTTAPDISIELSDASRFEITRTSLKLRNPENAPGTWELAILNAFQAKAAAGADPDRLEAYEEITTAEGDRMFRYMGGIATGEMCLSCHGPDIKADVKAELVRYYPDDKATGYRLGELRGAFSLVKLVNE